MTDRERDPEALNDRQYYNKWFEVFRSGDYPQGSFTVEDLKQIALNYDPDFCEAPVWIGHPGTDIEPMAFGWVFKCRVNGDKLEVQFSSLDETLIELIEKQRFKRCSVELWKFQEKQGWYLYAIGLTNRPQVKGLVPLDKQLQRQKFTDIQVIEKKSFTIKNKLHFSEEDKSFFTNQHSKSKQKNIMQVKDLKQFADAHHIDVTDCETEADYFKVIGTFIDQQSSELEINKSAVAKFTDETKTLEEKVKEFATKELQNIVKLGIVAQKVLPSEEAGLVGIGEKIGAEELKKFIDARPVIGIFKDNTVDKTDVTGKVDMTQEKFKNPDGSPLTWAQFSQKVKKDPAFADQFTVAEQEELYNKFKS